jgi:hypothetical protein
MDYMTDKRIMNFLICEYGCSPMPNSEVTYKKLVQVNNVV